MSAKVFLDTNILVYAFDQSEPTKQAQAIAILEELGNQGQVVLSTQVLQEFFVTVTRKLKPALESDAAYEVIEQLSLYTIQTISPKLILQAIQRQRTESFSFWDALIVEAALQAECQRLLSEDMQDGREIENLRIENPFL